MIELNTAPLIFLAGLLLPAGIASASAIPVSNPSFATLPAGGLPIFCPGTGCGYSEAPIPGWVNSGQSGQYQTGTQDGNFLVFNTIPEGITIAFSDGPTISQTVAATVQSGVTYTLMVDIGYPKVAAFDGTADLLVNGTQYFATGTTPSPGNWSTFTATYTAKPSDVGDSITIQLNSYGFQADFNNVRLTASPVGPTTQILPQLAFGGGWYTALYYTNLTTSPVSFPVNFVAGDGTALNIPALNSSVAQVNLESRGTAIIEVPNTGSLVEGYAAAALPSGVTGYGVFRYTAAGAVAGQEAVVPLSGTTATTSTMIFDETSYTTGVAVVGIGSSAVTVNVAAYGTGGNTIGTGSIQLAANGQTALLLRDISGLSGVVGQRGSVDFSVSGANVAVLGIRYNGLAFTSIPTSDR